MCALLLSFYKDESRAPKPGVWLMRGAQPATSAGARLFAGSPIPALFTTPPRVVKKSILSFLYLNLLPDEHFRIGRNSEKVHAFLV
jgi:hypothetical protein